MIDLGDKVFIKGTVQKVELTPFGQKLFYMREQPEIPITEDNIVASPYVGLTVGFDTEVKKQLFEYVNLLEKARLLVQDLAQANINLEFCLDHDGERCPTVLASVFTDSCND